MIRETENPQEAKSIYPGKPARHGQADPVRYFTQRPTTMLGFSRDGSIIQTNLSAKGNLRRMIPSFPNYSFSA